MILIAHRGNTEGPHTDRENSPKYIHEALNKGFNVEIDVWRTGEGQWYLGHDCAQWPIKHNFLINSKFWIHCKNYNALASLLGTSLNYFYHTNEEYVLTSNGWIWAYPGMSGGKKTICVMPEWGYKWEGFGGICTDFVELRRDQIDSI